MPGKSILLAILCAAACGQSSNSNVAAEPTADSVATVPVEAAAPVPPTRDMSRLESRFDPPDGFARVSVDPGSYQAYLRELDLRTDRTTVLSYDGSELDSPSAAVAVLDVGNRDLQQCADSIMRLHAEWLWSVERADDVAYHFVSGDLSAWKDWRAGQRFRIRGNTVTATHGAEPDDSYQNFRRYLTHVFAFAATRSMPLDSIEIDIGDARAGDFLLRPGSPGHTVLLLDVAVHPDGRRAALIGQGFMPAQEFHVVTSEVALDGVWFVLPTTADGTIDTPSWEAFDATDLRRFDTR
jgi:hypothetical protein